MLWPDSTIEYGLLSLRQRRFWLAKTADREVVARAPGDRLKLLIPVDLLSTPSLNYEFVAAEAFLLRLASRHRDSLAACDQGPMLAQQIGNSHEVLTMLNNRLVQLHPLGLSAVAYESGVRALHLQAPLGNITSVSVGPLQVHTAVAVENLGHLAEAFSLHQTARRHFVGENTLAMQRATDLKLATLHTFCGQFPKAW